MDTCKSALFAFQFVKQTITHISYINTVLEIQFWSVKYTTVTVLYTKILSVSIPSHQAMQAIEIG